MGLLTLGLKVNKGNEEIHFCGVKKVNSAHWATLIAAYSWELGYGFLLWTGLEVLTTALGLWQSLSPSVLLTL